MMEKPTYLPIPTSQLSRWLLFLLILAGLMLMPYDLLAQNNNNNNNNGSGTQTGQQDPPAKGENGKPTANNNNKNGEQAADKATNGTQAKEQNGKQAKEQNGQLAGKKKEQLELTDSRITRAVEERFSRDPLVPTRTVQATTQNRVVTLRGDVHSLIIKQRSEDIVKTLRGVRGIVNLITVKSPRRPDSKITQFVKQALLLDPATDSYEVKVSTKAGVVTLSGKVQSWAEKKLCEKIASLVKGVQAVNNKINVEYRQKRLDSEIKEEVEARLKWDVWVDGQFIKVMVKDGVVTLRGPVGSLLEKDRVYADAWVQGVQKVNVDAVAIRDWVQDRMKRKSTVAVKSDNEIKQAVKEAMQQHPRVDASKPRIHVQNGVVTLTGSVDNIKAAFAAEEAALNIRGVWRVKNYLKVAPGRTIPDLQIYRRVSQILANDPLIERYKVKILVSGGTVYLSGKVDTPFEKSWATSLTSMAQGVRNIVNSLDINSTHTENAATKSDWVLYSDVKDEIYWSPFVSLTNVTVRVLDGVVTLTGTVHSWRAYLAAQRNAREAGALVVRNRLRVVEGPDYLKP